jgi:hypothetical protein
MKVSAFIGFAESDFVLNLNEIETTFQVESFYFLSLRAAIAVRDERKEDAAMTQYVESFDRPGKWPRLDPFTKLVKPNGELPCQLWCETGGMCPPTFERRRNDMNPCL